MGRRILSLALRTGLFSISPFLRVIEEIRWPGARRELANREQPIFIIGAPRTGSTILYQALTNAFQVQYIDNIACLFHRNLRFGLWLSRKLYRDAPHDNFKSEYGDTRRFGGHAPSECGGFWYRWLPQDRHFIDSDDINPRMLGGIRKEILGATAANEKPILFKNLNAGQRLRLISRAFPGARIIFLRRDPRFVVRSILKARKRLGVRESEWWSIMPPNVNELQGMPEPKMVAAQVFYLEKQIEQDIGLFDSDNVRVLQYNCLDREQIHLLAEWLQIEPKPHGEMPEFQHDDPDNLAAEELGFLNDAVNEYAFSKELFA